MQTIKLVDGTEFKVYATLTMESTGLIVKMYDTTLAELEAKFIPENLATIQILDADKNVVGIYNSFSKVLVMSKESTNSMSKSAFYTLADGELDSTISIDLFTVSLKLVESYAADIDTLNSMVAELMLLGVGGTE